ncbi:hypothetical protein KABACHOK_00390 [Brevundimonas phage vB_BpoS-Kabachok]|uniref:Uncharacterized protein n=2 Tax=Marchewkavirus TaxID=3425052 RepID=A0A9E7MNE5_9CAUD|nr:hypothetical protein KABACHOK_00390 [Brevundimonas phage vB_BpoS-Kabachok]USN14571.1 hypothetical protein DOMOVOI_00960 [Brevundimonas phage vB_BpoS-Domovoi]
MTYVNAAGAEVLAGEIPKTVTEIDVDFLGAMVQRAYDAGRRHQQEDDARQMEECLTKIRQRVTNRGPAR